MTKPKQMRGCNLWPYSLVYVQLCQKVCFILGFWRPWSLKPTTFEVLVILRHHWPHTHWSQVNVKYCGCCRSRMVWPLLGLSYGAPSKARFPLEVSANLGVSYPIRIASYLAPRQLQTSSCHRGEIHEVVWHDGFLGRMVGCSVICLDGFGASYSLFYWAITQRPRHTFFFGSCFKAILRVDGILEKNPHLRRFHCQRTSGSLKKLPGITRWVEPKPWENPHESTLKKIYTYNFHLAKGSRIFMGNLSTICVCYLPINSWWKSALSSADWTLLSLNYLCKEKARSVQTGIEPFITSTSWALVLSGRLKLIPNTIGFPLTVNYAACERVLGRATQVVLQQGYCVLQTCQTPCSLLFANMLFGFLLVRS